MTTSQWVSTVTHPTDGHTDCPALSGEWPRVVEQPIDFAAPGVAHKPASDYACTRCGCMLVLVWRTAVGVDVDHRVDHSSL